MSKRRSRPRKEPEPRATWPVLVPAGRRLAWRFAVLFFGVMAVYFVLTATIQFQNPAEAGTRPVVAAIVAANHAAQRHVLVPYQEFLAGAVSGLLRLGGGEVTRTGRSISWNGFEVAVTSGCDAGELTLLLCAAIAVFPASWRLKVIGSAAGVLAIAGLNFLRILSLLLIGVHWRAGFDFAHFGAWPFLLTLGTLAFFVAWLRVVARGRNPVPPPPGPTSARMPS